MTIVPDIPDKGNQKLLLDKEYQTHSVFKELDRYIAFYDSLADSILCFPTMGTEAILNIDSYVVSCMQGTLMSMRSILRDGQINDAYALLRKYYDSAIITIYTNLYLEENHSIVQPIVHKINKWLKGKDQLPEYRVMSQYIRKSPKVVPITTLLFADERYKLLRKRCNNHTHLNFYQDLLLNDSSNPFLNRVKVLSEFSEDLKDVFILHLSMLFFSKEQYMMSSGYVDYLDCDLTPPPDSQYWVAPFVQEIFDDVLAQHRPDIAAVIKEWTSMHIK